MAWKLLLIWSVTSVAVTPLLAFGLQRAAGIRTVTQPPGAAGAGALAAVIPQIVPVPVTVARPAVCAAIRSRHPSAVGRRHGRHCATR